MFTSRTIKVPSMAQLWCTEMKLNVLPDEPIDGANQWIRWAQACLLAVKRGQPEQEEERQGALLAIRGFSNGVFQFAVAGNERRLKPGQLFSLRRGGD